MTTTLGLQAKLAFVSVFMYLGPISQSKLDEARGFKNTVKVGEGGDECVCVYDAGREGGHGGWGQSGGSHASRRLGDATQSARVLRAIDDNVFKVDAAQICPPNAG